MLQRDFLRQALSMSQKDLLGNIQDLTEEELRFQPAPHANPIGFLLWHMARVEDAWVQRAVQRKPHIWASERWFERCGMPEDQRDIGHNWDVGRVAAFKPPPLGALLGYGAAVRQGTLDFLDSWDLETGKREVRAPWGTISVSDVFAILVWELNQHGGQVAYIRGLKRGLQRPAYMGPLAP